MALLESKEISYFGSQSKDTSTECGMLCAPADLMISLVELLQLGLERLLLSDVNNERAVLYYLLVKSSSIRILQDRRVQKITSVIRLFQGFSLIVFKISLSK